VLITALVVICCLCHHLFEVIYGGQSMMSSAEEEEADAVKNVCGWCGIAEVDNVKLEDCNGCDLVKYCSDNCRGEHRHWHVVDCKRRAKELHDNKLFRQPDGSHHGECPICFLPLPLDARKSAFFSCCSKVVCDGCCYANCKSNGGDRCPFCRELASDDDREHEKRVMKRAKANDPAALRYVGRMRYREGDYDSAVKYWAKEAEVGDAVAHNQLGDSYYMGDVVEKDEEKAVYHYEKAAICGLPRARHNLGCIEERNGNMDRAVKHFIINASLGDEDSMKELWGHYSDGNITKEDLEVTLRTHKAAIDATKSSQREEAEACRRKVARRD
jgi:hypothetical protein